MNVARVTVHAPVTSFRHPFFVTGSQPCFDFPPPSTVHGHCASAAGRSPDPRSFHFGLHFQFQSKFRDLEHQHIVSRGKKHNVEGTVQPVLREALFDATLTLYLDPSFADAFRAPVFPMALGRSQDLAEVIDVRHVELEKRDRLRLEHTLLPQRLRPCVRFGVTVLLPRVISPPPERDALFSQYLALHERVDVGGEPGEPRTFTRVEGIALDDLWADPTTLDDDGVARGVWMHRLADG
jgi:CRISPR-associated protein Cas5t